jgi:glycerol-3-phosphate dehydrogenase (NAD(P)+)
VIGVELGGALKNVIALAAGMADALDAGDNGKATLMCRGLAEITRLGTAMGADPLTFAGLAGMGDMIATCASPLSRNNRAGRMLADGIKVEAVAERLGEVAEGIPTAAAAVALGARHGVDLPIAREVAAVVAGESRPEDAVARLMGRELRPERD